MHYDCFRTTGKALFSKNPRSHPAQAAAESVTWAAPCLTPVRHATKIGPRCGYSCQWQRGAGKGAHGMVWMVLGVLVVVAVLVVLYLIVAYNGLVRLRNAAQEAWAQIDVQLKRRYDLIPNLVETVKGYASHEKDTLERVVKARQAGISASTVEDQAAAENMISGALRQLFALSEAYPDLKANQNFLSLQEELSSTENKIGFARQYYNDQVRAMNTRVEMFPTNIIAGLFGFKRTGFFELEDGAAREAPKVSF